jgi:hypothetical protein
MRPVAVSVVGDKLWVVNHLSDSVSVVGIDDKRCTGEVERTLLVGDEPRDVVSARGRNGERFAFVTAAHRGQNVNDAAGNARDPELARPGIGRADVFVFRADHLGTSNAEKPITTLTLFTDSPRALAVGNDKVFAAGFLSGNQTSLVRYQLVVDRGRQSLRKLDADGDFQIDAQAAFKAFNVAFAGLNGRATQLTTDEMQKFTNFVLALTYPPNPIRRLDNELTEGQQRARSRFFGCAISNESFARGECVDGRNIERETLVCNCANPPEFQLGIEPRPAFCPPDPVCTLDVSDFQNTCNGCHRLDPDANAELGVAKPGLFGSSGLYTNDGVAHVLKIPHLRNIYQKVGMFGSVQTRRGVGLTNIADSIFGPRTGGLLGAQNAHTGEQIRGFGFTHAGEEDTIFHFFSSSGFARSPTPGFPLVNDNRAGFETTQPRDPPTCYDGQLTPLNQKFIAQLAPRDAVEQLTQQVVAFGNPASTPEQRAAALQAIAAFIGGLPPGNPGSVFQRLPIQSAAAQLKLPLVSCVGLPPAATLQELGCFDLRTRASCATLISTVQQCAIWGTTLEQILPNGTKACHSFGLDDKAEMEDFVFAFDSNLKPIVGQQVTLTRTSTAQARARLQLLIAQADQGNCDLVARTKDHSFAYAGGELVRDDGVRFSVTEFERRVIARGAATFTAVPPGEAAH